MTTFGETNHVNPAALVNDDSAYQSGDVVGGLLRFDMSHIDGTIHRIILVDSEAKAVDYTLYLYDQEPTEIADNGAFTLSAADVAKECGKVILAATGQETIGTATIVRASFKGNDGMPVFFNGQTLWGYLVVTGTPTYTGTDALQLKLTYWPDKAVQ